MQPAGQKRGVNPIVKALVVLHMFLIFSWSLPNPAPAVANGSLAATPANVAAHPDEFLLLENSRLKFNWPLKGWLLWSGTWQYWDMFAPNPANVDLWYDALVTYKSGDVKVYEYPRMKTLSIWEKYFKERYRKFLERVNDDKLDSWKRPAMAQRIALLAYRDPNDPPVEVRLRRHWRELGGMDKPVPTEYSSFTLPAYIVDLEKLRRDAGR